MCIDEMGFCFARDTIYFSPGLESFLALSAVGHSGARVHTTAQVWVAAGFRGASSRRSKSRDLSSNYEIVFLVKQDNGNPHNI